MNILLALVPISVVLLGIAIWAFVWAVRRGQFDDLETPALDILVEDAPAAQAVQPSQAADAAAPSRDAAANVRDPDGRDAD
ncbi:MAG TPA: cbb3-type cytochrome oxidase assembly protein CcoS [Chiayiivirga sp.]|jgi:cbb3-type cytochrome oxidase maturation protein|uniref:Cbb3-type cytochrome oxidase assembly protein CcoS n=1 Tax=Denitratimonas tolerans TaxID=1338420 RepID=A0AAW9R2D5_9GAMM|nr:cbb3-type cytochrome oxidase assembly protein CcoS [Xanthomonadaceae bacterium]MDX9763821.1 cbb3-type cytochrome oxidase assembly protein CcoS [Chiayiivirga sp.]HRN59076.1 cbb3-type cytochrome oxidase assembly protein CcoS [Chiayiivirga sp.]